MFDMPAEGGWEARGGWVVRQLVADLNLTYEQACGLVGNLGYESACFATLQEIEPMVPGSRGGYGWAQWTGPRRRHFEDWAAEKNLSVASDEANYGFLVHELKTTQAGFLARLRGTCTIEESCHLTHRIFESPSDVQDGSFRSGPDRLALALRLQTSPSVLDVNDPVELIKAAQRLIGAVPDGIPGNETRYKLRVWMNRQ